VRDHPSVSRLLAAFASIYFIWGSTFLVIRFAIETVPPFFMAGIRFLSAGAILYLWARLTGAKPPRRGHWPSAIFIGALLFLAGNGGVTWSEQHVPSGLVALIIATIPIWMALLDWIAHGGKRPGRTMIVGLLLGVGGIALLVQPERLREGGVSPASALLLLVTSACWAAGSLYSRTAPHPDSPRVAAAMQLLAGGALLIVAGFLTGEGRRFDPAGVSLRSALSIAYLSLLGSVVAFTAYIWLLKVTTAARVSTYAYVNPVVALFLGWAFGAEPLTARTLIAALVIVVAVIVITLSSAGEAASREIEGAGVPGAETAS
jgi:drug/metabolite transporter (DMT)-like permease